MPDHPWRPYLERSALTLKGLSYAPTGAIMAAATTSLPETPGGARNYDYRYTWIRDSAFMLRSLYRLGFGWEAVDYFMASEPADSKPAGRTVACLIPDTANLDLHPRLRESAAHFGISRSGYRLIGVPELAAAGLVIGLWRHPLGIAGAAGRCSGGRAVESRSGNVKTAQE